MRTELSSATPRSPIAARRRSSRPPPTAQSEPFTSASLTSCPKPNTRCGATWSSTSIQATCIAAVRPMPPLTPHLFRLSLMLALIALALVADSPQAKAVVELNITQGKIQPLPIAIPDFTGDGSIDPQTARAISAVVAADLASSGLFTPIDQAAFIQKVTNFDGVPRFDDWQVVNAQALVVGRIGASDEKLKAEFRLWDVFSGKQLAGESFFARAKDARRVGHIIADAIYERITGEKGYFDTRIVFVDESGPKD